MDEETEFRLRLLVNFGLTFCTVLGGFFAAGGPVRLEVALFAASLQAGAAALGQAKADLDNGKGASKLALLALGVPLVLRKP